MSISIVQKPEISNIFFSLSSQQKEEKKNAEKLAAAAVWAKQRTPEWRCEFYEW